MNFFSQPFLIFFIKEKIWFLVFSNENNLAFHMRYHFCLHYGWFLQNLGKDFIRTNMHTTVIARQNVYCTINNNKRQSSEKKQMIFNLKISTISNINWPHCAKVFTTALTTAKSQRVNCKAPILFAHKKHNELIVLRALFPFHGYDMNWAFLHNRLHFENAKALKSFECHKGFYEVDNRIYSF